MKKENGITLISLAVTIIVLLILASITTYTGLDTIRSSKFTKFQQDLEIMQAEVNVLYEKYKEEENVNIGRELDTSENEAATIVFESMGISNEEKVNYKVFDEEVLKSLNIEGIERTFLVNIKNRKVICLDGYKYQENMYYSLEQIRKIPEIDSLNRDQYVIVDDLEYEKTSKGYKITLKNIECSKYVGKYTVKYKEHNDSVYKTLDTDATGENYTFEVDNYGLYYIKIVDAAGRTTEVSDIIVSVYGNSKLSKDTTISMVKSINDDKSIVVENVAIPAGFTISGIDAENAQTILGVKEANEKKYTIDDGVVLYLITGNNTIDWNDKTKVEEAQKTYDQFVWVPVPDAVATSDADLATKNGNGMYPMAVAIEGTDSKGKQNYRGVLYDFGEATDAEGKKYVKITAESWSTDSKSNREPVYLEDSYWSDGSSYNNVEPKITQQLLQEEYNAMIERVNNKKGFWVGRYETSNMVGTATTSYSDALNKATVEADKTNRVTVIRGTTTGISYDSTIPNYINWYRMYAQQKNYSKLALEETTSSTSSMIWGSQWDQIMIWMKEVENTRVPANGKYFVTNSAGYGNYGSISGAESYDTATSTSSPAATGSSEYFKVKNIYDLAGNVSDWSLEANNTSLRVFRGGLYTITDSFVTRADNRYNASSPYYSDSDDGSRATLY